MKEKRNLIREMDWLNEETFIINIVLRAEKTELLLEQTFQACLCNDFIRELVWAFFKLVEDLFLRLHVSPLRATRHKILCF